MTEADEEGMAMAAAETAAYRSLLQRCQDFQARHNRHGRDGTTTTTDTTACTTCTTSINSSDGKPAAKEHEFQDFLQTWKAERATAYSYSIGTGSTSSPGWRRPDHHKMTPQPFSLSDHRPYERPEVGDLVSFQQPQPGVHVLHRVGVVSSISHNRGTIDILKSCTAASNDDVEYMYQTIPYDFSEEAFGTAQFRIRHDLCEGQVCYDTANKTWCQIQSIPSNKGGVHVVVLQQGDHSMPTSATVWMPPDHLVGACDDSKLPSVHDNHKEQQVSKELALFLKQRMMAKRKQSPSGASTTNPAAKRTCRASERFNNARTNVTSPSSQQHRTFEIGETVTLLAHKRGYYIAKVIDIARQDDNDDKLLIKWTTGVEEEEWVDSKQCTRVDDRKRRRRKPQWLDDATWEGPPVSIITIEETTPAQELDDQARRITLSPRGSQTSVSKKNAPTWKNKEQRQIHQPTNQSEQQVQSNNNMSSSPTRKKGPRKPLETRFMVHVEKNRASPNNTEETKQNTVVRSYARGKFCKAQNGSLFLLAGEIVRYQKNGAATSEFQYYDITEKTYITVTPPDDDDETQQNPHAHVGHRDNQLPPARLEDGDCDCCLWQRVKSYARQAELADANKQRKQNCYHNKSPILRPFQPVQVKGGVGTTREAIVLTITGEECRVKVQYDDSQEVEWVEASKLELLGGSSDGPFSWDRFFETGQFHTTRTLAETTGFFRELPGYLLEQWRNAHSSSSHEELTTEYNSRVLQRDLRRRLVQPDWREGQKIRRDVADRMQERCRELRERLATDYGKPKEATFLTRNDVKRQILVMKEGSPYANILLLCGGIAPEVAAYKRLGVPLGVIILQDTDMEAVGCAVAAYPDVHFAIVIGDKSNRNKKEEGAASKCAGDINILADETVVEQLQVAVGGIHNVHITNPCDSWDLLGRKEGLLNRNDKGLLLYSILGLLEETSGEKPMVLAENLHSTEESKNVLHPSFEACGSMCSPSERLRRFCTQRPPVECCPDALANQRQARDWENALPPSLNGDLPEYSAGSVLQDPNRRVHPATKKFDCFVRSEDRCSNAPVWELRNGRVPRNAELTPLEMERAVGYNDAEIGTEGVTKYTAVDAILERIDGHDFENSGCLVSLKGCGENRSRLRVVQDNKRKQWLGNSQTVTLLEALLWNDRRMFPAIEEP
ncbi:expressed unknown protein [Seminavis robusta]|uniref:Uncharacterized protein n=1 Tax=Seminavis robusta TaxID=568900 RepID=A0A9N8E0J8_9STRA|nr:expressed unknown protein [Seminavis robusta]|eukprot:Sro441_g143740.1 n/a (1177) ;mRNA; f:50623-54153